MIIQYKNVNHDEVSLPDIYCDARYERTLVGAMRNRHIHHDNR